MHFQDHTPARYTSPLSKEEEEGRSASKEPIVHRRIPAQWLRDGAGKVTVSSLVVDDLEVRVST